MFTREQLDSLFAELKQGFGTEPDWEQIVRDAHLGVARSDAGVDLGAIDPRVMAAIEKHQEG